MNGLAPTQKLTEAELKEQEQRAREASEKGVSVWNQVNTMSDRVEVGAVSMHGSTVARILSQIDQLLY